LSFSSAEEKKANLPFGERTQGHLWDGGSSEVLTGGLALIPFIFWAAWVFFQASHHFFIFRDFTYMGHVGQREKNLSQGPFDNNSSRKINNTFFTFFTNPEGG
jgi:hypothetical protein